LTRDLLRELKELRDHLSEVSSGSVAAARLRPRRRRALATVTGLAVIALAFAVAFVAGRQAGMREAAATLEPAPAASFRKITFRRGTIWSARFAPDGQTIVYSAAWDGARVEPFLTRSDRPEARPLGFRGTEILSVSSSGEMALSLDPHVGGFANKGTLARAPLLGGAPRPILEDVESADWSPDGGSLAVVRTVAGKARLEFPIGKTLYETSDGIGHPRVSPKGDLVAFLEYPLPGLWTGSVAVVDLAGRKKTLGRERRNAINLAWVPGGDEIWFTATDTGLGGTLHAVTLSGRERLVLRVPDSLSLHDIARDGRLLLTRGSSRHQILGLAPGQTKEQDLSWLNRSQATDLSADGKMLLITEFSLDGGPNFSIYLRKTDSASPPVLLGEGHALALSPDLKWALAFLPSSPRQLILVRTGPGEGKQLSETGLQYEGAANWFPDGKRILCVAHEPDRALRIYVQDLQGGRPRPVTPEGVRFRFGTHSLSPDGALVAATGPDGKGYLYAVEGGEPRPIPGLEPGEVTAGWGADGRSLYVYRDPGGLPSCKVFRVDLATGRRELWKEITPPDPAGVAGIGHVHLTPDTKSYVYEVVRVLSDLYLVEGLK
jgi:Tol biopolymer transport system component